MSRYAKMPNIEALCIEALKNAGIQASTNLPTEPTWPRVTLNRVGGIPAERHKLDTANLQVDCWGEGEEPLDGAHGRPSAFHLANEARQVLHELEGTENTRFKAVVAAVDDLGLIYLADPKTKRARYILNVSVSASSTTE